MIVGLQRARQRSRSALQPRLIWRAPTVACRSHSRAGASTSTEPPPLVPLRPTIILHYCPAATCGPGTSKRKTLAPTPTPASLPLHPHIFHFRQSVALSIHPPPKISQNSPNFLPLLLYHPPPPTPRPFLLPRPVTPPPKPWTSKSSPASRLRAPPPQV